MSLNEKDITPRNNQGYCHGYWEYYHSNGVLWFKGNYIYDQKDGLFIWLGEDGITDNIEFYV